MYVNRHVWYCCGLLLRGVAEWGEKGETFSSNVLLSEMLRFSSWIESLFHKWKIAWKHKSTTSIRKVPNMRRYSRIFLESEEDFARGKRPSFVNNLTPMCCCCRVASLACVTRSPTCRMSQLGFMLCLCSRRLMVQGFQASACDVRLLIDFDKRFVFAFDGVAASSFVSPKTSHGQCT